MSGAPARPAYGRVGPADPHADPATHPALRPADVEGPATDPGIPPVQADPEAPTVPTAQPGKPEPAVRPSRTGGLYAGIILSAIVLIFLLVFILQNQDTATVHFLGMSGSMPLAVAMLFSVIAGGAVVALVGGARILQLRKQAKKSRHLQR